jgi:hypothetical protein
MEIQMTTAVAPVAPVAPVATGFQSHNEFLADLNAKTTEDLLAVMDQYKLTPFENEKETVYFAKYLLQGERKGLTGTANVVYARTQTTKLANELPHLLDTEPTSVSQPSKKVKSKVATPKAPKVAKDKTEKPAKVAKVKADKETLTPFTVFFRADRNKFMAVNGEGKAEAARPTAEACLAFLFKKYNVKGKLVK